MKSFPILVILFTLSVFPVLAQASVETEELPNIPGLRKGLTVVVGTDTNLAANLQSRLGLPVQCLCPDVAAINDTRDAWQREGAYGKRSIIHWPVQAKQPHADKLITLLAIPDAAKWQSAGMTSNEILGLLALYGTALLKDWKTDPDQPDALFFNIPEKTVKAFAEDLKYLTNKN